MAESKFNQLQKKLFTPIDPSSISLFRVFFGCVLLFHLWEQFWYLPAKFIIPKFHFSYPYLDFIQPMSPLGMYFHHTILAVMAMGILFGAKYKLSALIFLIGYLYTFLIDTTYYKNHFYLVALIGFLMLLTNAHAKYTPRQDSREKPVYFWNLLILRLQFCIVYFYAGVAKINGDWFRGEPLFYLLGRKSPDTIAGWIFQHDVMIYFFSYGGLIFDLTVPFLLWFRKTRVVAACFAVFFHSTNFLLFPNIKVFVFLMLSSLILFFEPDWPRKIFVKDQKTLTGYQPPTAAAKQITTVFLIVYLLIQIFMPLRHFLYPGNVLWTSQGERFAWRMVLKRETGRLRIYLTDPKTEETREIDPLKEHLVKRQYLLMRTRPEMVLQYAHFIGVSAQRHEGIKHPIVTVDWTHSFNGRPHQRQVDPTTNLSNVDRAEPMSHWVLPFNPALR